MRLLLLATCLPLALAGCSSSHGIVQGSEVGLSTSDGAELHATYQAAAGGSVPTLLLLHQPGTGRSRRDFDPIWSDLLEAGFALLAPDLRGHGYSSTVSDASLLEPDTEAWPADVERWLSFLEERQEAGDGVDAGRLGAIGLGAGASLAAAALGDGQLECAVALSATISEINALHPGFSGGGAGDDDDDDSASSGEPDVLSDQVALHHVQWITGSSDEPAASDAAILEAATSQVTARLETPGPYHGVQLLEATNQITYTTVQWCLDKL